MERSIVAVEENHQRGDSAPLVPQSLGSLVKIDSISIDLGIAMEKYEAGKCPHFSIRGYVAEMRKKDRKICSPFAFDSDHSKVEEQLPPLYVAKFRWWRCQNCLQEIGAATASEEIGAVSKCCKSVFISSSSCSQMPSHGDAAMVLSDLQRAPILEKFEGRKADDNTSANLNGDENYLSLCSYKKEKKADVEHTDANGHENVLEADANQEIFNTTCALTSFDPYLVQERHTDVTVAIKSKSSGSVELCEPNSIINDAADIGPAIEYPKRSSSSSAETFFAEKMNSSDEEQRNVLMPCETSKEGCKIDDAINVVKDQTTRLPFLQLAESDNASSESDEILTGDSHSSGLPRRKTRKVRLLTELLGRKGNAENVHRRTVDTYSSAIPDASTGLSSVCAPRGDVALRESVGIDFKDPQRKRKMPQYPVWKPRETSCSNNMAKKVRTFNGDVETTKLTVEISDSETEEDASAGIGLQNGVMSQWGKHGIDSSPTLGKKKTKEARFGEGYSPLVPWREVMPKINHIQIGDAEKRGAVADTSFSKSTHDSFRGRGMETYFKSYMPLQQTGNETNLSEQKYKMPQFGDGHASLMPRSRMFGESSTKKKDVKFFQTGSEIVKPPSANGASAKIGLELSLNSYITAERNDKIYIAQFEDKIDHLLPQQKGIPSKDIRRKDGMYVGESSSSRKDGLYVGESSSSRKSAPSPFLKEGLLSDLNERIAHRTAILREQQYCTPQLEDGSFSLHQKLDSSVPCNNKKTFEVQGRSEIIRMHDDHLAEKMFEQGTSDDIPMEIVELMAKNQYERGLYESGRNYCLSERTNQKRNAEMMGFPKVDANGVMRSLQKEYPSVRKPASTSATTGIIPTGENVVPSKRNHVNFSHGTRNLFDTGQRGENPAFTMFGAFSQSQQKLSSGVQFSASGTVRSCNAQNREWHGDKMAHRSSPTSMQVLEEYSTCRASSRQNEEAGPVWSFMTPNHMPFGRPNIPQNCATQSSNIEMHAQPVEPHRGKIGDFDLNLLDLNAANLEKQNQTFDFEPFKGTSAEHPFVRKHRGVELNPKDMRSLDPYSNETIPAMQLLSLMDAGMQSTTPFNVEKVLDKPLSPCDNHPNFSMNGKHNFLEKPRFPCHKNNFLEKPLIPCHYHSKEFSGIGPGVFNASISSRHPSSAHYGKNHPSEKSCECSPAVPAVDSFVSLLQNDRNFKRAAGSNGQVFVKSQEQGKTKRSYPPTQNRSRRPQKSVCTSGVAYTVGDSNIGQDKQKGILGASDSVMFPLRCHTLEGSTKRIGLEARSIHGTVRHVKSISRSEVCCVNRNPADFSIPGADNMYMISSEDLRFGKKIPSRGKSRMVNVDGRKGQRITKLAKMKENAHHTS